MKRGLGPCPQLLWTLWEVFVEFSYSLIYVCRMWCLNVELAPRHGTTELKPPIRAELGDRGGGADLDGGG